MSEMVWKDELLPGASRVSVPYAQGPGGVPGSAPVVLDTYGRWIFRNDWVRGDYGIPKISGSGDDPPYRGPAGEPLWSPPSLSVSTSTAGANPEAQPVQMLPAQRGGVATVLDPYAQQQEQTEAVSGGGISRRTLILAALALLLIIGVAVIARRKAGKK